MKYYDKVPKNFLLIRFVATRFCNYRCPYCYVPLEKQTKKKTMFSHHSRDEWIHALKDNFSDRNIEFYFTGGEPLIINDCVSLIKELVEWDNVSRMRIDSNLSTVEKFLKHVDSKKIRFLTAFHPTQISLDEYTEEARKIQDKGMVDLVNFVASKENLNCINMPPHKLIKIFDDIGIFLNIAKDFYRGRSKGAHFDINYKRYVDILQHPLDNYYMNHYPLNKGFLCGGGGRHYITINRHGKVFSCGGKIPRTVGYGNIFDKTLNLPDSLHLCEENCCPSIISYSFSCSNEFLPFDHAREYVKRCSEIRKGIPEEYLKNLWEKIDIDHVIVKKSFIEKMKKIKNILTSNKKT
jgi:MoaA/NifB/PqqE/SkfB family radical SAM enzyme